MFLVFGALANIGREWDLEDWRNLTIIIAAAIGFPLAFWRSWVAHQQERNSQNQFRLAESGQNIDRYQKGATMLGDSRLSVRQAGILVLTDLAKNRPHEYAVLVQQLLCSFVRDRSAEQMSNKDPVAKNPIIAPDNQTAVFYISHLIDEYFDTEESDEVLLWTDFKETNLTGGDLKGAILRSVDFYDANLSFADLSFCDLSRARLSFANLIGTKLADSDLTDADLSHTNLYRANIADVVWDGANVSGVKVKDIQDWNPRVFAKAWAWEDQMPQYIDSQTGEETDIQCRSANPELRERYQADGRAGYPTS